MLLLTNLIKVQTTVRKEISTKTSLDAATRCNGPIEKEATLLRVKPNTPANGHPDLLVKCLPWLQQIEVAGHLSTYITFWRKRPCLGKDINVPRECPSTRWKLVRPQITLLFTACTSPQNTRVARPPKNALAPCLCCILNIILVFRPQQLITLITVPILLRKLVLTDIVVLQLLVVIKLNFV